jgi:hypothetical protein
VPDHGGCHPREDMGQVTLTNSKLRCSHIVRVCSFYTTIFRYDHVYTSPVIVGTVVIHV